MIKINLATRKQSSATGGESKTTKKGLGSLGASAGGLSKLPIKRILLPLLVGYAASFLLESTKEEELKKLDARIAKISAEQTKLKAELDKTKGFEAIKKDLERDELLITTKIDTIQKLVSDRQAAPKMLLSIAHAMPAEVWLSFFKIENSEVSFKGNSAGFNQISDLMKNLNESAYFSELRLQTTQQIRDDTGFEVASFELAAKRR